MKTLHCGRLDEHPEHVITGLERLGGDWSSVPKRVQFRCTGKRIYEGGHRGPAVRVHV